MYTVAYISKYECVKIKMRKCFWQTAEFEAANIKSSRKHANIVMAPLNPLFI